jgi:hypothetical protein
VPGRGGRRRQSAETIGSWPTRALCPMEADPPVD